MIHPTRLFRGLIVLSIGLSIVGATLDVLLPSLIPEALRSAHEASLSGDFRTQDLLVLLIGVPLIIVGVVNVIALYRFQAWAPRGAFYITIVALAMYPLTDVQVISPWALLLTETSFLLWGAALAMAFFPPISERFRELPANSSMQPTGVKPPAAD